MALMNLLAGKWASQAITVAAELQVADLLRDGSKTAPELAKATATSADGMHRLLRALAAVGLCAESGRGRFRLTRLGRLLRRDVPQSVAGFARFVGHDSTWRPWGELRHSVRTTEPAFDHVFGTSIFEYYQKVPEAAAVFQGAMTSLSTMEAVWVVDAFDFTRIATLVDVAGGHGLLLATVLAAHKKMHGVLFDVPHVVADAPALLAERGVAGRCEVVAGSFFESVPGDADAYMMKHIIHDWDDERAIQILLNCHRAMKPGGRVLIIDVVLDSTRAGQYGQLLDLEMLTLTPHGRERTKAEFTALLKRGGFKLRRITPTAGYLSIVEGTRA